MAGLVIFHFGGDRLRNGKFRWIRACAGMQNLTSLNGFSQLEIVSIQKRGILVAIKACEKFDRRHMVDIPRIKF